MSVLSRIAWRNVGRHRRRSIITSMAMGLGAALCITVISFADGLGVQMFETVVGRQIGHAQIHHPDYPRQRPIYETIPEAPSVLGALDDLPETVGVAPRAHGFALLAVGEEAAGAQLTGIDPEREGKVTALPESMVEGDFLDGTPGQIILGRGLADTLRANLGDEVVAVTQAADGSMGNELYEVKGIYRIGSAQMDRAGAFVSLDDIQSLLALDKELHEIALTARHRNELPALLEGIDRAISERNLLVRPWSEIDPVTAQMLEVMDAAMLIVLILIFSVASLGILNTMLMSVFERIRELGVLQALGLRPPKVLRLILWETLFLCLFAALGGGGLGILLAYLLETRGLDLSGFIEGASYAGMVLEPVMFGELRFDRVAVVIAFMFVISFIASIWPAIRAARLDPVAAMRQI